MRALAMRRIAGSHRRAARLLLKIKMSPPEPVKASMILRRRFSTSRSLSLNSRQQR